MITEI